MENQLTTDDYTLAFRKINVVYSTPSKNEIADGMIKFADKYGFALLLAKEAESKSEVLVKLYRSDIKFTGVWDNSQHTINLSVFPVLRENVQEVALNQGVNAFKQTMQEIKNTVILEKKMRISAHPTEREPSINSLLNAKFNIPDGMNNQVRKLIYDFSNRNDFAVRFAQNTPDQDSITAYMYKDNIEIFLNTPFSTSEVRISCYPLVGIKPTQESIEGLFNELKNIVETIEGVKFEYRK